MNFTQQEPRRHLAGLATVIFLHIIAIYALSNGLARKVVDVLKKPLEINIIEEIKSLPPPPPEKVLPPPRQVVEPPPAYVPPPEVQVQTEVEAAPVISVTTSAPPPPVVVVPVAPVRPAVVSVSVACPNYREIIGRVQTPPQAIRMGLSGEVLVEFTVSALGAVSDIVVAKSTSHLFNSVALDAVAKFQCIGQGQNVRVRLPIGFELLH